MQSTLPCFGGFSENVIMQDFWISMYLANMAAIAKNEADAEIKDDRADKDNKYDYQANVNTLIGSLRDKLADAIFSRNPAHRQKKLERIMLEIKHSVVPIRLDDGSTPRYEYPRKSSHHVTIQSPAKAGAEIHNRENGLWRKINRPNADIQSRSELI